MIDVVKLVPVTRTSLVPETKGIAAGDTLSSPTGYENHPQQHEQEQERQMRPPTRPRVGEDDNDSQASGSQQLTVPKPKKPFSFYMSILMLAIVALTISWDSTTLAVATPVRTLCSFSCSRQTAAGRDHVVSPFMQLFIFLLYGQD